MTFHKYPKIKLIGNKENVDLLSNPDDFIYIQEKIDGANFRFMPTEDGRIIFGSRNQSIGDDTQEIGGNWKRCVEYILSRTKNKDMKEFAGCIFYGECCVKHSLEYNWDMMPAFLGFDIMVNDRFICAPDVAKYYYCLNIPTVPLIWSGRAKDMPEIKEVYIPKSAYAMSQAEGIVIKNYQTQTFAKFVTSKFKEVNRDTFGKNKKYAESDDERMVAIYCTNARIDKQIFKLVNDGNALDMPLMEQLPKLVYSDIVDENWKDILNQNWTLNLRNVRKLVSKRCVNVLQQVITNNALNR
jgi:hypothetical protein